MKIGEISRTLGTAVSREVYEPTAVDVNLAFGLVPFEQLTSCLLRVFTRLICSDSDLVGLMERPTCVTQECDVKPVAEARNLFGTRYTSTGTSCNFSRSEST